MSEYIVSQLGIGVCQATLNGGFMRTFFVSACETSGTGVWFIRALY